MSGLAARKPTLDRRQAWIARQPVRVLILALVFTVMAGVKIRGLIFSTSVRSLIMENARERQRYDAFKALFGADATIPVVAAGLRSIAFSKPEKYGASMPVTLSLPREMWPTASTG